ncbi:alpha/beta hydrolase [Nocardioides sp. YIM 152315]|uniref:alpha/beta hydrolase n=1 Tax=Nocardioides sp. YIM 152315 TaxID=3031760 RepID=UPI0023DB367C|nr:alpha/beta hydrolase [Nocardioides sp. YIM 152315]MDF1604843.1 alpha/beta hydrolase [Nocardioides sp. YIM 152315]
MHLKTLAAVAAGTLAAGLATIVPATAPAAGETATAFRVAPISWGRCDDKSLRDAGAECGTLTVPLDHTEPTGPTIDLAVARVLHTEEPYRGAVLTNPGGPGSDGTWLAPYGQYVPREVGLTYDWYGIDPRGTGASDPILTCDSKYFGWDRPDYVPTTPKVMKQWRKRTERYARDCGHAKARELLRHVRTTDTASDFDLLRQAIGLEKVTIFGFSYGTYLAQVYATLFPGHVQALVMDGVIDADRVFYQSNLDQDPAFQKSFEKFLAWVGKHPRVYHLGAGRKAVGRRYQLLRSRLAEEPARGKVGPDELDDALLNAAYYNGYYPIVADALADLANRGKVKGIKDLYRGSNPSGKAADNGYAMYLATECTDARWPTRWKTWRKDSTRLHRKAPFLTWANNWYNAPCRTWPVAGTQRVQVTGAGLGDVPILLLSETHDPATPYAGALATRRTFPSAALVAGAGGYSHAVSLSGIACTDNAIADVLEDGTLPDRKAGNRADKRCHPLAAPKPPRKGSRVELPEHRSWWGR